MKMQDSADIKEPFWKRRYITVLHAFAAYFLLNTYRVNLGVSIVAMVHFPDLGNNTLQQISNTTVEITNGLSSDQLPIKYNWSPKLRGWILGGSFFGYLSCLIVGGKLAETFGPKVMLITGTFISSLSTLVTPFTANVSPYFVIFIQFFLGIAQGFMFPAIAVLAANWFPRSERGLLYGLAFSGFTFGILISGISSSLICDSISIGGWPAVFYIFGGFGIFISILQMISLKSLPKDDPRISRAELQFILENQENKLTLKRPAFPWCKILRSMSTYALLFARFGQFWTGTHFITVHATFLSTILRYPMTQNGTLISTPYLISIVLTYAASFLSSFASKKKYLSISNLRKFWNLLGSVVYSLCLILIIFTKAENTVTIISTIIGIAALSLAYSGIMLVPLDMTPTFAGSLSALSTTFGTMAGFLLPIVCGVITNEEQTLEQWNKFFIISIVIVMSSAIFFCIFGSAEIQKYNFSAEDLPPTPKEETKIDSNAVELRDTSEFSNHI